MENTRYTRKISEDEPLITPELFFSIPCTSGKGGYGWTLFDLKNMCHDLNISSYGTKSQLCERLTTYFITQDYSDKGPSYDFYKRSEPGESSRTKSRDKSRNNPTRKSVTKKVSLPRHVSDLLEKIPTELRKKSCSVKPKNGKCPADKPFMVLDENGQPCCYKVPKFNSIRNIENTLGDQRKVNFATITKRKHLIPRPGLSKDLTYMKTVSKRMDTTLTESSNLNERHNLDKVTIIIYDFETTGLKNKRTGGPPDAIQLAMYSPGTDSSFMIYIKPSIPIEKEAEIVHGISEEKLKTEKQFKYHIPDILRFIRQSEDRTLSVDRKHKSSVDIKTRSITLEELDIENQVILIAHNGFKFDEPIFRNEFAKIKKSVPDNWIFADSYHMALTWIRPETVLNFKQATLYQHYLNSYLENAHDALADTLGLWKILKAMMKELFSRNDLPFIKIKLLEFIYQSELLDYKYLKKTLPKIVAEV